MDRFHRRPKITLYYLLTRVVFHHVLVVPISGRRQVHGGPERRKQSDIGRTAVVQSGGGRAEFTDGNGIAAEHHRGAGT